jgi:hypothetical protein
VGPTRCDSGRGGAGPAALRSRGREGDMGFTGGNGKRPGCLSSQAERETEFLFFFQSHFKCIFKSFCIHFEFRSKPLSTINHMHQHEFKKNVSNPYDEFLI